MLAKLGDVAEKKWFRFAHLTPRQFEVYQRLHNERLVEEYGENHEWLVPEGAGKPKGRDDWRHTENENQVVVPATNFIKRSPSTRDSPISDYKPCSMSNRLKC